MSAPARRSWRGWRCSHDGRRLAAAPEGTAGAAGGLLNAVRQTGATLGVALMGAFAGLGTVTGSALSLLLAAVLCGVVAVWFNRGPGAPRRA
ncbi:hypothetical protein [Nonomuraea sp. NPDC050405]|uniref:hypothetical protein n=1 Tax=Nonomuraea sp. NPDC050405 TaxID=3154509 RepID=UPI0033D65EF9